MHAVNPATREVIASVLVTSPLQIAALVEGAHEAARRWGDLTRAQRARALAPLRELVAQRADEIAETVARSMGKPLLEVLSFEVATVLQVLDHCIAQGGEKIGPPTVTGPDGVRPAVACILAPVSSPFERAMTPAVRALIEGSAVLIKPTASAPLVGVLIAHLFEQALADFPSLAQVVFGDADLGTRLATADGVERVFFSGSRAAAVKVHAALARVGRPARFALKGVVGLIVCDDANLERAANATVFGRFSNNGQGSATVGRVYVQRAVAAEFVHKVVHKVRALKSGPHTDPYCELGPLASGRDLEFLRAVLQDALDQRAVLVTGGFPAHVTGHEHGERRGANRQGFFWPPTVVIEASRSTRLMREDVFGPILPVCMVEDDREAISLVNEGPNRFGACVFSHDVARAQQIAAELDATLVVINDLLLKNASTGMPSGCWPTSTGIGSGSFDADPPGSLERIWIDDGCSNRDAAWFPYSAQKLHAIASAPRQQAPARGLESVDG